jgi:hypothetical protein
MSGWIQAAMQQNTIIKFVLAILPESRRPIRDCQLISKVNSPLENCLKTQL